MKLSSILGLNARSQIYTYRYNTKKGKKICDSKILTERFLKKADIPAPEIVKVFRKPQDVFAFNWDSLSSSFALKPSRGMGGEGIIVVKKRADPEIGGWVTTQKTAVSINDLKLHTLNILEGAYSMGNEPDVAFIQEYVGRHKAFRKYAFRGTPDIRVIVFNKVPVMAMLRLPTKESGGRANLHQGAIGVGIDIATGITTKAIWHGKYIKYKPDSNRKLNGIKIPFWTSVLKMAINAQIACQMGYTGVDIVFHPEKGPMILEMNAQPGLQIQLCNSSGLRKRLDKIEDLEVRDEEHGVKIAKALFVERFTNRVAIEEGIKTVGVWEKIKVVSAKGERIEVQAKLDTGAWKTSIDKDLAERLNVSNDNNILWTKFYKSGLGQEKRKVINLSFYLAGRKINTTASIANREGLRTPLIIGRRDLVGFLIKPGRIK
ncbi:sugar-transfer associated ATP-grasp domain-containing protein [Patescibacteria group bacterium]